MKKVLLILLLVALASNAVFAYSLKEEAKYTEKDFAGILKGKLMTLDVVVFSGEDANLFIMTRDAKKRYLEWYFFDPFNKKILANGNCPFRVFEDVAISPNGKTAVVFSKYPTGMWSLDLKTKKWKMIFKNKSKGLAIVSLSPLAFIDNLWAFTILDDRDAQGYVIESIITYIIPNPFRLERIASLKVLEGIAIHQVYGDKVPPGWLFQVDDVVVGPKQSLVYVLNSKTASDPLKFVDYLFHYRRVDAKKMKINLIDKSEGGIFPLDYDADPMKILYRVTTPETDEIKMLLGGKKIVLAKDVKALVGSIMKGDIIGVAAVKGESFSIYLGKAPGKLQKVLTTKDPYKTGFCKKGDKLILINDNELRCFKISE